MCQINRIILVLLLSITPVTYAGVISDIENEKLQQKLEETQTENEAIRVIYYCGLVIDLHSVYKKHLVIMEKNKIYDVAAEASTAIYIMEQKIISHSCYKYYEIKPTYEKKMEQDTAT